MTKKPMTYLAKKKVKAKKKPQKKEIPKVLERLGWTFKDKRTKDSFQSPDKRFSIVNYGRCWELYDYHVELHNKGSWKYERYYLNVKSSPAKSASAAAKEALKKIDAVLEEERLEQEAREKVGDLVYEKILNIEKKIEDIESWIDRVKDLSFSLN